MFPDLKPLKAVLTYMLWLLQQIALKVGVDIKQYPGGPPAPLI